MKKDVFVAEEDQIRRSLLTSMVAQYRLSKAFSMDLSDALNLIGYGQSIVYLTHQFASKAYVKI